MKLEPILKQPVRTRWPRWPLAVAPFVALAVIWPQSIALDDAYITLHNARVLLSGQPDPVYGSSYLAGATSFIHLALVALISSVMDPVKGSVLLSLTGAALYIAGLFRITDRAGLKGLWQAAVVLIGAFAGTGLWLYTNGLETSLGMAAVAWLLVWCDDRRKLPILAGLVPFLRPELGLLSLLLMLRLCWAMPWREALRPLLIAAACAVPWIAWTLVELGELFPSTLSAKRAFFRSSATWDRRLLMTFFSYSNVYQLPLFIGLAGLHKVRAGVVAGLFLLGGMIVSFVAFPDAANWNMGRYTAMYFPIFIAGLAAIAAERTRASFAVVAGLLAFTLYAGTRASVDAFAAMRQPIDGHATFVASLPADAVVMVHDAGQVAWAAPRARLVDMVGLKTPEVTDVHRRFKPSSCKLGPSLDSIARRNRVTHVAVLNFSTWPCVAKNLREEGWRLSPIYQGKFTVYRLTPQHSA